MAKIKKVVLKSGKFRWEFCTDGPRDPVTGKRKQIHHRFESSREAKEELARIEHQVDKGTYVANSTITVDQFLDEWLEAATRDVEAGTAANYRDALRPVRTQLGRRRLQAIVEKDVDELVDWMLTEGRRRGGKPGTGLGVRSVRLTLGRFRSALNVALRRQLVTRNVAAFTTIPRAASKAAAARRAERRPWNTDEVKAFLTAIRDHRLYAVLLLSLMGLRPAEVCGLRWADVDFDAALMAAGTNTRTLVDGQVVEKPAKSAAGERGLPIPPTVLKALRAFKRRQAAEKLAAGEAYASSGYVLVDEVGQPQRTDWLRRRAQELMAAAGLRRVRLYDARHACLTYLATQGVPDVVLAAWAGHADGGTLAKKTYIVPDVSHLEAAAKELDSLFG